MRTVHRLMLVSGLLFAVLPAACGGSDSDDDKDEESKLETEPSRALVVGTNYKVEADLIETGGLDDPYTHGYQVVLDFNVAAGKTVKISVALATNACIGIDEEAGKIEGPFFSVRAKGTDTVLVTTRIGKPNSVPSFEFPGELTAGSYVVEALWVANKGGCGVNSELQMTESEAEVKKFPDIVATLNTPFTYDKQLVEGGSDFLFSAVSLDQEFRLTLTEAKTVTLKLTAFASDCSADASTYTVYDYQAQKNVALGDLTADFEAALGALSPGLYGFNIISGNDTACGIAFSAVFEG